MRNFHTGRERALNALGISSYHQYWQGTNVQCRRWQTVLMPELCQYRASVTKTSALLARHQSGCKFPPGPRWKSRIHASIYKRHSATTVVNNEQCLYCTVGTEPRNGVVLAQHSPSPQTQCQITTEFIALPVLNQYGFQCWRGTVVQYRTSTDAQLSAKLPFGAALVVDRAYARNMPVTRQCYKNFYVTGAAPIGL